MISDKEIEGAAESWARKYGIGQYQETHIFGFTAGAKWMQEKNAKEIELLKTKIEQERSHIRTCHIAMEGHHKEIEQLKQRLKNKETKRLGGEG